MACIVSECCIRRLVSMKVFLAKSKRRKALSHLALFSWDRVVSGEDEMQVKALRREIDGYLWEYVQTVCQDRDDRNDNSLKKVIR